MLKKISFLILALCLVMAAQSFTGCSAGDSYYGLAYDTPLPDNLKGTWVSPYSEEFIITDTQFSSLMGGSGYGGTVVRVRNDGTGSNSIYITIRYTRNDNDNDQVGRFYVIHVQNIGSTNMEISGAYDAAANPSTDAAGRTTQAEAEAAFTVLNGCFGNHSSCSKLASATYPSPIQGTWDGGSYEQFVITDKFVTYSINFVQFVAGQIVHVRDLGGNKGYITFQYIYNYDTTISTPGTANNHAGKYCVLYWENLNTGAGTADIGIASIQWTPGDESKATLAAAEAEYTIEDDDDYYDLISCDKQ